MPKTKQDPSEGDHKTLNIFTGLVVILGIIAFIVGLFACQDEALITVDRLARYNLGFEGAFVLTIKKCAKFAAITGVFIAIWALIGAYGTKQNNKQFTCVYNVGLITCGLIMFILGVHALGRQVTMEPIITRQVGSLCVEPTFIRLTQQLACANTAGPLAEAAGAAPSPCNAACTERATTLDNTGEGCALLEGLCNNFLYVAGSCPSNLVAPQAYFSATDLVVPTVERCQRKCDHDMLCVGFKYTDPRNTGQYCYIVSSNATRYAAPSWTSSPANAAAPAWTTNLGGSTTIQLKGENAVLNSFTTFGYGVALLLLFIGIALVVMWLLTMRILYNQNINKPGKPNAHQVGLMLCCPCLGGDEYQEPLDDGTDFDPEE